MGAVEKVAAANEEATEAWDGVLFDRFFQFRDIVTTGLGAHGEEAMRIHPPSQGDRVLDVGCGFGDTTQRLAELVGPEGEAVGIDVSERFVEESRREAEEAGATNVSFIAGDVQIADLGEGYDYVFSRMGVMFFANPVAALSNIRSAMAPGGRFTAAVWRRKLDNEWVHRAERVVERYLEEPEDSDEPTCGPGPFSMASAVIRLVGEDADEIRPVIERELREALTEFDGPGGVMAPASTWIVGARAPAESA
jgi:ubiquinone/menaquinone biosynthesis C-methylase UbiE